MSSRPATCASLEANWSSRELSSGRGTRSPRKTERLAVDIAPAHACQRSLSIRQEVSTSL